MFGNILIDRIRFSKRIDFVDTPYVLQQELKNELQKYFLENAFNVKFDKKFFRVDFNPTRYLDEVTEESSKKPNLNLDMIDGKKFLRLLQYIYHFLGECNVTWIDITKNLIVENPVQTYIKALYGRKFKYPYKVNDENSDINNSSLVLSPLKRKKDSNCRNLNRQITFYDKIKEIQSKTKNARFIDNIWLTSEEIAQIPSLNYEKNKGRLYLDNLHGLNILRCEQRYKYTANIKRITHFLLNLKEENELRISTLIYLLSEGTLYNKLDEFYTEELRKYVFFDAVEDIEESNNKYIPIIKDLIEEYNEIDLMAFEPLFTEIGYKDKFHRAIKIIQQQTLGIYYNELYNKFNI